MSGFEPDKHPALDLGEKQRRDYLTLLGAMVVADERVDDHETAALKRLGAALGLPDGATAALAAARGLDADGLRAIAKTFHDDYFVRQQLLTDAIVITFSDGVVDPHETDTIAMLAGHLGLTSEQAALIGRYVQKYIAEEGQSPDTRARLGDQLAAGLGDTHDPNQQGKPIVGWIRRICGRRPAAK